MISANVLIVIPARYESSRFPGKPLVDILGKSMIQRVYEGCVQVKGCDVVVATDDERIVAEVQRFGGEVELTSSAHPSGTDRVGEVAARQANYDFIINVQGDEPLIDPRQILLIKKQLEDDASIATLLRPVYDPIEVQSPHLVKAVRGVKDQILYFSRSLVPFVRNFDETHVFYQHLGIYGFKRDILLELVKLPPSRLEQTEGLEQLRWLEHGYEIKAAITEKSTRAVDTPEDLEKIITYLKNLEDSGRKD